MTFNLQTLDMIKAVRGKPLTTLSYHICQDSFAVKLVQPAGFEAFSPFRG